MRTIIWFFYFWIILFRYFPVLYRIKKLDREGRGEERDQLMERSVSAWAHSLLRVAGVQVEVSGIENIPTGPVVFVSNHQGNFDIPILLAHLDRPHGFVAKIETQKIPFIRSWMKYLRCVFLDRSNPRQAMSAIGQAAHTIQEGKPIILFPEGTRSRMGNQLLPFKGGTFKSAVRAKCPIVPCALIDSYKPFDEKSIAPVTVKLIYLPPICYEEYKQLKTPEIADIVKTKIEEAIRQYS